MSLIRNNHNKYDTYLLLLIVSTIFGEIGGALTIPRALGILLAPRLFSIFKREKPTYLSSIKSWAIAFYIFALVSMLWTPDKVEGFKELIYYPIHFLIFLEVVIFSQKAFNPLGYITLGVILCVFLTSIVGFWELITDNHLAYSALDEASASTMNGEVIIRKFAAVTFYNLNGYVTYLCLFFPFLLYGMSTEVNLIRRLSIVALIISVVLILCNASRGGLLTLIISIAIYFLMSPKSKSVIFSFIIFLAAISIIFHNYGDSILLVISMKVSDGNLVQDDSRFEIWGNALKVFFDYFGLGCGIGGMHTAMAKFANGGITITHNIFLEILCQYGLVFCIAFIKSLYNLLRKGRNLYDKNRRLLVTIFIISFPMTCIINSGYLLDPHLFIVLASIYVFANYEHIRPVY